MSKSDTPYDFNASRESRCGIQKRKMKKEVKQLRVARKEVAAQWQKHYRDSSENQLAS